MVKSGLLLLSVLFSLIGSAQKYSFITFSTEKGLPQSQVTAISQDDKGYLWVGTLGGLAKFNGDRFTTFSSDDGLLNNRITTLNYFEGTLWVGHDGGISMIRNNKISSIGFSGNDKSRNVSKIIRFKERLFICSNGGGLFELRNNQIHKINLGNDDFERVRAACVQGDVIYLATRGGVLQSRDGNEFKLVEELGDDSFSGVTCSESELIFSTYTALYRKNIHSGKMRKFEFDEATYRISGSFIDRDKNVWLNSSEGIIRINNNGIIDYIDASSGLPLNMISCVYQDANSNVWLGSQGKGIFRFPGETFEYYDVASGFPTSLFISGFQDGKGDYYFGTFDQGIVKRAKNGEISQVKTGDFSIWSSLYNLDGKNWFGTESSLVSIDQNGQIKSYSKNDNVPGVKVTALYKIDGNSMYIGGSEGVSIYRKGKITKLGRPDAEFIGTVRDFEVVEGVLYCVTNLGLFAYEKDAFTIVHNVDNVVYNLEKDAEGNLWFGTEEGLFKIQNNKIHKIHLVKDPASNYINFLNYRNGKMYVGTNNGLFVLSKLNSKVPYVERFGNGDGIVDVETNLNSSFFDNQGNFWFGTASGLVRFNLKSGKKTSSEPIVHLKSVLLNYQTFDYSDYSNKLSPEGIPLNLSLPFSKNNLIFELDGISLEHHHGLKYQFLLEGMNEDWSPLGTNSTITFTSLPAGDYMLKMRVVDIDGRHSDVIEIPLIIRPAFYKTWWFYSLSLLSFSLIVLAVFRFRIKRINEINEKEKLEIKTRLLMLEQKSVNASMNRHFIFNSLNSIQYFINTQDKLAANKYLTNFAQLIRKNLDSASAEGNRISLEEELTRLRLYLSLEAMRFKDRFDYNININSVETESLMIPSMIMQPFVENSIIHGILPNEDKKGQIDITVNEQGEYLHLLILDNGIGVQQSLSLKAGFEGDHKSQGMEITSKRIELIQKIAHQDMSLIGPEEIVEDDGSIKGTRVLIKLRIKDLEI